MFKNWRTNIEYPEGNNNVKKDNYEENNEMRDKKIKKLSLLLIILAFSLTFSNLVICTAFSQE